MTRDERTIIYTYETDEIHARLEGLSLALHGDPIMGNNILALLSQAEGLSVIIEKTYDGNDSCALQFMLDQGRKTNVTCFFQILGDSWDGRLIQTISFPLLPENYHISVNQEAISTREMNQGDYFIEIAEKANIWVCPDYLEDILLDELKQKTVVLAFSPKREKAIVVMHNQYDVLDLSYQSVPLRTTPEGLKALLSHQTINRRTVMVSTCGDHLLEPVVSDIILIHGEGPITILDILRRLSVQANGDM